MSQPLPPTSECAAVSGSIALMRNLERLVPAADRAAVLNAKHERVTVGQARSGAATLAIGGRPLCSGLDPQKEGLDWAKRHVSADRVDFLIVYGLGMGHHVEALQQLSQAFLVVVEPSAEVIAATLGQRELALERTIILRDPQAAARWLSRRLVIGSTIEIAAWPPTRRLFPSGLDDVRKAALHASEMSRLNMNTLEVRLDVWVHHLLQNLVQSAGRAPASALRERIAGRPAIVVSAGPSLSGNVGELRAAVDRATIVAVNTSLRALEQAGVRADLVVAVESLDVSSQLQGLELNARCPRVLGLCASPVLHARAEAPVYPFAEALDYFDSFVRRSGFDEPVALGGSVANAAFSLLCQLGASSVILVGQDLAYSGGRAYARGTVFEDITVQIDGQQAKLSHLEAKERIARSIPQIDTTRAQEEILLVDGWSGERVPTTRALNYFRYVFEEQASDVQGIELVNATEGGARIHGFHERALRDVVAGLPEPTRRPLPEGPRLDPERIGEALEAELAAVRLVRHVAKRCAEAPGPSSRVQVNEAVARSGLVHARAWRPIVGLMRDPAARTADVYQQIALAAESLAEEIALRKKELKLERDPPLRISESSEQLPSNQQRMRRQGA